MVKDIQQRLIRALRILREPSGSKVPAIVKVVNKEEPHITLKDIVKTLQGCLEKGIVTQCKDRIRLKYSTKNDPSMRRINSSDEINKDLVYHEMTPLPDASVRIKQRCGPKAKPKPKPKAPKSKPKCPKPKPKSQKPKPKSPKKPKCPKSKPKPKPKCAKPKKPKIQPYCKKQPETCCNISEIGDF